MAVVCLLLDEGRRKIMLKNRLSEKAIPILFDVVVWSGFAAFLVATYIAWQTLVDRFPGPVDTLLGVLQKFVA